VNAETPPQVTNSQANVQRSTTIYEILGLLQQLEGGVYFQRNVLSLQDDSNYKQSCKPTVTKVASTIIVSTNFLRLECSQEQKPSEIHSFIVIHNDSLRVGFHHCLYELVVVQLVVVEQFVVHCGRGVLQWKMKARCYYCACVGVQVGSKKVKEFALRIYIYV